MARIVIVGGGLIGSAVAWYLAKDGAAEDVVVIEPDPTYEFAATPRSVGAVRLIQGLRENLEMSLYGREVYTNFDTLIDTGGDPIGTGFNASGFMFCEQGEAARVFERNHRMSEDVGADVRLLDRSALKAMMPSFRFDDIDAALYSPGDGRIDPHAALQGFRRGALHLGVAYRQDRVTRVEQDNTKATGVTLESGDRARRRHRRQRRQLLGARRLPHGRHGDSGRTGAAADLLLRHTGRDRGFPGHP